MELNIYEKGEIKKTYEMNVNDLLFGTIDDVSKALDIKHGEKITVSEISTIVSEFIDSDIDKAKEIVKGIFDGLTDEELRNIKMTEFMSVIVEVIGFTIGALGKASSEKN